MSRPWSSACKVLVHAKLDPTDLLRSHSQSLHFGHESDSTLDLSRVRLMEVDSGLAEQLEEGQTVLFRGDKEDNAVLCTQGKVKQKRQY